MMRHNGMRRQKCRRHLREPKASLPLRVVRSDFSPFYFLSCFFSKRKKIINSINYNLPFVSFLRSISIVKIFISTLFIIFGSTGVCIGSPCDSKLFSISISQIKFESNHGFSMLFDRVFNDVFNFSSVWNTGYSFKNYQFINKRFYKFTSSVEKTLTLNSVHCSITTNQSAQDTTCKSSNNSGNSDNSWSVHCIILYIVFCLICPSLSFFISFWIASERTYRRYLHY